MWSEEASIDMNPIRALSCCPFYFWHEADRIKILQVFVYFRLRSIYYHSVKGTRVFKATGLIWSSPLEKRGLTESEAR